MSVTFQDNNSSAANIFGRPFFLLVILIEAFVFLCLIFGRYIPGGSDGLKYFYLQYYFLNNVVNYGEIPQWCPFLTHGAVTNWQYIYQGGIFQDILLLSGGLLKAVNFLPVFYCGIFIDHLLLLVGVWLLGKRFYASPVTLFFVALSIMGASIWLLQVWWNFHFYYAIPLILYLGHRFIDNGQWRYFFWAGNLVIVQAVGGLPYFLPATTLVIFLYFLFYCLLHLRESRDAIRRIRFGLPFVVTIAVTAVSFAALYTAMNFGTDQIQVANPMRNIDGSVDLDVFLTYGGKLTWQAWAELALGVSPSVDYSLYIGIICLPLILAGIIFNTDKKNLHLLLTAIVLVLFSMGTAVSVLFYYVWPMMKYFRHLALVTPIIRIFLCFLAGLGVEALLAQSPTRIKPLLLRFVYGTGCLFMIGALLSLWYFFNHREPSISFFVSMVPRKLPLFLTSLNADVSAFLLCRTSIFALAGLFFLLFLLTSKSRERLFLITIILLIVHGLDIYSYKIFQIKLRTAQLNDEMYSLTVFDRMPYPKRRDVSFKENNPRAKLLDILPLSYGVFYWTTHVFLFKDQLGNAFQTDNWMLPLDRYMKAYWGQPLNDKAVARGLVYFSHLEFPLNHPAALKISGATEDKIQFFSQAKTVPSDELIAAWITAPDYAGDQIFLSPLDKAHTDEDAQIQDFPGGSLSDNRRLRLAYKVNRFDSNHLEVTTVVRDFDSAWLLYSDVWHPFWRATVNGRPVPVYRANLAYKAVRLEKGENTVHFYFKSQWLAALYAVFGVSGLFWLFAVVYLVGKIIFCSPGLNNPMLV